MLERSLIGIACGNAIHFPDLDVTFELAGHTCLDALDRIEFDVELPVFPRGPLFDHGEGAIDFIVQGVKLAAIFLVNLRNDRREEIPNGFVLSGQGGEGSDNDAGCSHSE